MSQRKATITAVGHYVPDKVLTNHDLEKMVDTNDEWIRTRTGIREPRIMEAVPESTRMQPPPNDNFRSGIFSLYPRHHS